jgi:hypothetical protein
MALDLFDLAGSMAARVILAAFLAVAVGGALLWFNVRARRAAAEEWRALARRFDASLGEVSAVRRDRTANRVTWVLTPDTRLPAGERPKRQHQFGVDAAAAGRLLEGFEFRPDIADPAERWITFVSERVPESQTEIFVSGAGTPAEFTGHSFPALVAASQKACADLAAEYAGLRRLKSRQ